MSSAASLFALWSAEQDWYDAQWRDLVEDGACAADLADTHGTSSAVDVGPGPDAPTSARIPDIVTSGTALAAAAARVLGVDPGVLSADDRLEWLVVLERARSVVDAAQARVLAVLDRCDPNNRLGTVDEVGQVLRLAGRSAQNRLKSARTLVDELPNTLSALATGVVTPAHALAVCQASWTVPPEAVGALESAALAHAGEQTVGELKQTLRRAVFTVDVDGGARRHLVARQDRRVEKYALDDGMAQLAVTLPATEVAVVFTRLDAAAHLLPSSDERSMDERRADLFVDAVLTGIPGDGLPSAQGRCPAIQVTVAATTLLGLDEVPGHLQGHGPIPADLARRIAADQTGTWRRLLTDPTTGALLEYGRTTYRPPQQLRDFILARDGECCFPGCRQPAYRCEIEHCQPYDAEGTTDPDNLAAVCKHHHQLKTNGHWSYSRHPDGTVTWTSATGRLYRSRPPQRWPQPPREPKQSHDPLRSPSPATADGATDASRTPCPPPSTARPTLREHHRPPKADGVTNRAQTPLPTTTDGVTNPARTPLPTTADGVTLPPF